MRTCFLIALLFGSYTVQAQKDEKVNDLVVLALNQAADTTKIFNVRNILASKAGPYKGLFVYIPSINPLNPKKLKRISSKFGKRFHPIRKKVKAHLGLDISAKKGTAIHASATGSVLKVISSNRGYGNQVIIEHDYGFRTRYAHMHSFIVKKGDSIKKGQIIGFVGNTGLSTAPHLHYEIIKQGKHIDPYPFCFLNL